MHKEAEKEERRVEKEEIERQKQLKRQQEKAEKVQRRREKEEAESRTLLALQKQASLMERFLNRNKTSSYSSDNKATTSRSSSNVDERNPKSVTLAMDAVFAQNDDIGVEDIWKLVSFTLLPFCVGNLSKLLVFKFEISFVLLFSDHT